MIATGPRPDSALACPRVARAPHSPGFGVGGLIASMVAETT
jgi:hypothetical protein